MLPKFATRYLPKAHRFGPSRPGHHLPIARRIAATMATTMVLDAIEQAIWSRQQEQVMDLKMLPPIQLEGSQYTSIRFTERLAEAGIQPSVGAGRQLA